MPWFKVDDKLHDHRKARQAGKAAMGVWALAGSWCMDHLTDGFVPESVLIRWGNRRDAARLCTVNLWETATKNGEEGWQFLNWEEFQPSKAEVESEREATRERVRKWREGKRGNAGSNAVTNAPVTPEVRAPRPDPTRPDPSSREVGASGDEEFDDFWTIYPRKEGKGAARKAYAKALKSIPADELLPIVRSFSVRVHGTEPRFIPFPATWLNQERWADEVDEQKAEASGEGGWFQPFTMPPAPPGVEDDPEAYDAWAEGRRQAWRNGERW